MHSSRLSFGFNSDKFRALDKGVFDDTVLFLLIETIYCDP